MNKISAFCLAFAALFSSLHAARSAPVGKPTKPDPSDEFFTNGYIPFIRIEIDKTNFALLRREERKFARCTIREGTNVWHEVGIHKKGAAGSNRDWNDNPALTLNFDKFIDRQKFHGLDKLYLNNSVQDPSLLCEAVCAKIFLDAGIPAGRVTHARVELNGKPLGNHGLYVLKEGFDKTFLRRHFTNTTGNLYDGGFIREVTDPLEKDSGTTDVKNHADLKALAAAAQDPDLTNRFLRLEKALDMPRFLDFVALEMLTWHWDGYAMNKNNFRIYHDPSTDKLHFLPHGMDQMFWAADGPLTGNKKDGLVFRALLETPQGRGALKRHQAALLTNVFTAARITNHLNYIQSYLHPALLAINKDMALAQSNKANDLRYKTVARVRYLDRILLQPVIPVAFDGSGVASLKKWEIPETLPPAPADAAKAPAAKLDRATSDDGRKTLHIAAVPDKKCTGSWRTRITLEPGNYLLEAMARTAGVTALTNDVTPPKGVGAGIRLSRGKEKRKNELIGDNGWTKLEYEFTVPPDPDEVWLICELRAATGEAWFDADSIKLRKK